MGRFDRLEKMAAAPAGDDAGPADGDGSGGVPSRRVCVVSGRRAIRDGVTQVLEDEGCTVIAVDDRDAFLTVIGTQRFDLVLAAHDLGDVRDLEGRTRAHSPEAEFRRLLPLGEELFSEVLPYRKMREVLEQAFQLSLTLLEGATGPVGQRCAEVLRHGRALTGALGLVRIERDAVAVATHVWALGEVLAARQGEEGTPEGGYIKDLISRLAAPYPLEEILLPGEPPGLPASALAAAQFVATAREGGQDSTSLVQRLRSGLEGRVDPLVAEVAIRDLITEHEGVSGQLAGSRLLLADADRAAADLLELRLRNEGFEVLRASDGQAALERAARDQPALALVEVALPRLDGFTVLDRLKGAPETASLPVVLLTVRSDAMTVNRGLMLGAEDVVRKPLDADVLMTKINRLLGLAERDPERIARRGAGLDDLPTEAAPAAATEPEPETLLPEQLKAGMTLGRRFHLDKLIGAGGMGWVYLARDQALDEVVALKVLRLAGLEDEEVARERFKQEIKLARKITHPHVVRIFDFMEIQGLQMISMEYVEGRTLKEMVEADGALDLAFGLRVVIQICAALTSAHGMGVVHRDVKPQNVLIRADGLAKVLDFGIARMQNAEGLTRDGRSFGTPEYMSPEQIMGKPQDHRSDIYSLGCLMYEMFTGKTIFVIDSPMSVAMKQVREMPAPVREHNPDIPAALEQIIIRMLQKAPDQRYQTAQEVDQAIRVAFERKPTA